MSDPADISLALPPGGLDPIHDVLVELHFDEDPERVFTKDDLLEVWKEIPRELRLEAHKWGSSDTVVRDEIFEFLQKQRAK